MRYLLLFIVAVFIAAGVYFWINYRGVYYANKPSSQNIVQLVQNSLTPGQNQTALPLKIPDGYSLGIFASGLSDPRVITLDPNGIPVISLTSAGRVVAIINGQAEDIIGGLNQPHGLVFLGNQLYIAETDKVSIFTYDSKNYKAFNGQKIIDLPGGGEHFTRTLLIKDNKLYVSIGSDCNACVESDPKRASIWQANLDGSNFHLYSSGLRNAVFMITNPNTNEIWATDMGRDFLGDDLPPDTVQNIKEGANYGWPYCYGDKVIDQEINPGGTKFDCSKTESPIIQIPAHSAPLGLAFLGQDLLIAYHGSWNRSAPTGYKIVKYAGGQLSDFMTGWLQPNGDVLGRPVDILVNGGNIYITDDKAGVVYLLKPI